AEPGISCIRISLTAGKTATASATSSSTTDFSGSISPGTTSRSPLLAGLHSGGDCTTASPIACQNRCSRISAGCAAGGPLRPLRFETSLVMPGIVGLITKRPRRDAESELTRMLDTLRHGPRYLTGTCVDEASGVYLGWSVLKNSFADGMPLRNERGNVVLVFSGEEF